MDNRGGISFGVVSAIACGAAALLTSLLLGAFGIPKDTGTGGGYVGLAAVLVVVFALLGFFLGNLAEGPYRRLGQAIRKSADLDFSEKEELDGLGNTGGCAGEIAEQLIKLDQAMGQLCTDINDVASSLSSSVADLMDTTSRVNEDSSDNSATSEELAAGMEETAASVHTIADAMDNVRSDTKEINKVLSDGLVITKEIQVKAQDLENNVARMRKETDSMYEDVRARSDEALRQSKAVEKINEMAKAIMDIASQTSLLALNASIEAARAGESGRGFAVVAEEIGKLAGQSSETVNGITEIVKDVHEAVDNMSGCLSTLNEFLEEKVAKDYDQFIDVSQQYNNDAHVFQVSLQDINYLVKNLADNVDDIAGSLDGINTTVGEAALGITDIAQKTTDVVELSNHNYDLVNESARKAEMLGSVAARMRTGR